MWTISVGGHDAAGVLGRGRPDHLDQHSAVRRQRGRHRAGLPLAAAASSASGASCSAPAPRCCCASSSPSSSRRSWAIPFLKLVGGLLLLWIAVKLIVPSEEHGEDSVKAGDTLWRAVWLVTVADIVMSLDNVIAIAAAAETAAMRVDHGACARRSRPSLIVFGLATSVPLIIAGSALLMKVMERFPILVWAGAALLGWVAGEIIVKDAAVVGYLGAGVGRQAAISGRPRSGARVRGRGRLVDPARQAQGRAGASADHRSAGAGGISRHAQARRSIRR